MKRPKLQAETLPSGDVVLLLGACRVKLYAHAVAADPALVATVSGRLVRGSFVHPTVRALRLSNRKPDLSGVEVTHE